MKTFFNYLLCACLLAAGCTEIIYLPAEEYEEKYGKEQTEEGNMTGNDENSEAGDNIDEDDDVDAEADSALWDGVTVASRFESGMGTKGDPIIIKTPAQFALFASKVRDGEKYSNIYFKLVSDINLNDIFWPYSGGSFSGYFDGNGKTIEGYSSNKGLFDDLWGSVCNLTMKGRIRASEINIGSVSGWASSGAKIQNCVSFMHLLNSHENTGGFVGYSSSANVVNNNVFAGTVDSSSDNVGGIVGILSVWLEESDFDLYGYCPEVLDACVNKGMIKGNNNVGGLIGSLKLVTDNTLWESYENVSYLIMKECVNVGNVEANDCAGGLVGYYYVEALSCYDYQKKDVKHIFDVQMVNNLNLGSVKGLKCGGICGYIKVLSSIVANKDKTILYLFNQVKFHFDNCVNNNDGGFAGAFENNYLSMKGKSYASGRLENMGYWLFDAVGGSGQQKPILDSYESASCWYTRDLSGCYVKGEDDLIQKLNDYVENNLDDTFSKWQYVVENGVAVPVLERLGL